MKAVVKAVVREKKMKGCCFKKKIKIYFVGTVGAT
jgi:hypothetical protein